MKHLGLVAVLAGGIFALLAGSGAVSISRGGSALPAGSYIVVYKSGVNAAAVTQQAVSALGVTPTYRYGAALGGFAAHLTADQAAALQKNPNVEFLQSNGSLSIDGLEPLKPGDTAPPGIQRIGSATATQVHQPSKNIKVAVIDTGSGPNSDLNRTKKGEDCVNGTKVAADDHGHGTHTAGTIGAINQGSRVVGVAPSVKEVPVKVCDRNGQCSDAAIICGIDFVAANGPGTRKNIHVANMSLGGGGSDDNNCGNTNGDAIHKAICGATAKGVTFVVSAGNSGTDFQSTTPASYSEVLTVTAMTDTDGMPGGLGPAPTCFPGQLDDKFASFSNFATLAADQAHTIAAPGVCVLSDWLNNTTNTISGTSMSAPHVTGTVAECINDNGVNGPCAGLSPAQIIQKIRSDAAAHATAANGFNGDPNHPVAGRYYGFLVYAGGY
jgi:subtilisin